MKIVALQETSTPTVSVEHNWLVVMGTHKDKTYYYYISDHKYILNVEALNCRLYTEIDYSGYRVAPLFYLSPDGHLYIMEMFEDRIEVSEIKLNPEG